MNLYYHILWGRILIFLLILASLITTKSIVLAETKETSILIDSNNNNSYKILVKQAENLAKNAVTQEFKNHPEITEISVSVLGERSSQIVPVLRLTVSRSEWQKNPDIDNFTRYFADAKLLLKFQSNSTETSDSQQKLPNTSTQTTIPAPPPPPEPSSDSQPIIPNPPSKSSTPPTSNSPNKSPSRPSIQEDPGYRDD